MPAPSLPAGSIPHKMTAKAGEGVAAVRKQRLKLLLPHLWHCLLSYAAQQRQKYFPDGSSNNSSRVDASLPLPGVRGISTSIAPRSKRTGQRSLLTTVRSTRLIIISCLCILLPIKRDEIIAHIE